MATTTTINNKTFLNFGLGIILVILLSLSSSLSREVFAHGTGYRNSAFKAVALEFMYSTGEAMSYREARVFSPNDEKFAYQSGRTDEKGRFSFVPDVAGKWRVIVRDEEGHQCTAEIDITPENLSGDDVTGNSERSTIPNRYEILIRSLLGVSLIFNIALIIRRRHAH